jgi:hypothetical protein
MPSRAEIRLRLEQALRGMVIAALAVMLWQSLQDERNAGSNAVSARGAGVRSALAKWSALAKAPGRIHVQWDSVPAPAERAWLGALAGAGSSVTWSGDIPAVMIEAEPVASPTGGTRVLVAAPTGSSVLMSDDVGVIDTVRAQGAGAALALNSVAGNPTASVRGSLASTLQNDSLVLRKVLVIGDAGWETKFVVAALEEEGWKVDAFIRVAPTVDVTQGSVLVIDTARYSAVVALDGAASPYATRIIEFARTGGGVVLAPQAASLDAMAALRAGAPGRANAESRSIQANAVASLATLPLAPITSLRSDAVQLERKSGAVATAARRIGSGRVLQLGYEDTWRWRMAGGEDAVRDHRVWWTALVSSVAHAPRVTREAATAPVDAAPMVGLVAAIGPRTSVDAIRNPSGAQSDWIAWLFVLLSLGLIGEVASRRLRGAS